MGRPVAGLNTGETCVPPAGVRTPATKWVNSGWSAAALASVVGWVRVIRSLSVRDSADVEAALDHVGEHVHVGVGVVDDGARGWVVVERGLHEGAQEVCACGKQGECGEANGIVLRQVV